MSQENVEAVSRAVEVFNRDGSEAAAAFLDPAIEWHDLPEQPDAGVHHGRNGFLAATEQFTGGFEYLRILIDEIFDHGDQSLPSTGLLVRQGQRATFEQLQAPDPAKWIIVRVLERSAEALRAVGLRSSGRERAYPARRWGNPWATLTRVAAMALLPSGRRACKRGRSADHDPGPSRQTDPSS
jgi:hypothetical protein